MLFINNVGTNRQMVGDLFLIDAKGNPVPVDDTVFATSTSGFALVSDPKDNAVYKMSSSSFALNGAYSGDNGDSFGIINQQTGLYTPVITGLGGASGEAFVAATPEPASFGLLSLAFGCLAGFGWRQPSRR